MEWFENGYWDIAKPYQNSPDTIKQYLDIRPDYYPVDGTTPLNKVTTEHATHFEIEELAHNYTQKALTFQQFLDTDIDIIIASIPDHWHTYTKLRDKYKPTAKVICQMGNMFNEVHDALKGTIKNFMSSTIEFSVPKSVNAVFYHQEINTDIFKPSYDAQMTKVTSFVNLLPKPEIYHTYRQALSTYEFRAYGASCPDGFIHNIKDVAKIMQQSAYGFHIKPMGDGFGHVWFGWALCSRPLITNFSDYRDKLGGEVFEHKKTGIDLEQGTVKENIELIKKFSEPERWHKLSEAMQKKTAQFVNYDNEADKIKRFLANLF